MKDCQQITYLQITYHVSAELYLTEFEISVIDKWIRLQKDQAKREVPGSRLLHVKYMEGFQNKESSMEMHAQMRDGVACPLDGEHNASLSL